MRRLFRTMSRSIMPGLSILALACAATATAHAGEPSLLPKSEEVVKVVDPDARKEGLHPYLMLGASVALSSNSSFVGQSDGNSMTAGLNMLGRLDYLKGKWDWRNTLKVDEVFTRNPVINDFVKSIDQLAFESVVYLNLSELVGPFLSAKLDTPMLKGYDTRPGAVDYMVGTETIATQVSRLQLTDGFQPLSLKEAIGVFVRPSNEPTLQLNIRAGFGSSC